MCLYDPPLLLGTPDLSAAAICALPLAVSATGWKELLTSWIGLAVGFLAAHFFIVALHHEFPPSLFYWMREQPTTVSFSLATIAFDLVLLYAISCSIRGFWQGEYRQAARYLLLALVLVAAVVGSFAYLVLDARAFEQSLSEVVAVNVSPLQPTSQPEDIIPVNCLFPPFGEGMTGYSMLAALVIFEILVAVGIAEALGHKRAPTARGESKVSPSIAATSSPSLS